MYYHSFNVGFIDIPNVTTLNIYTVGCIHNCSGCHSKDLQDINHKERKILTSDLIIEKLKSNTDFYKGICWLGGDPLYQFDEFININRELKLNYNKELLITAFTGYEFEKMELDKQLDLISYVDILIDGPWTGKVLSDPETNQKIWVKRNDTFELITYNELENKTY